MQYYYTKNSINVGISLGLLLFSVFFIFTTACTKKEVDYYRITEVNDGDTVTIVTNGFLGFLFKTERVRLIGIDAPELAQEPWGKRAKNHLRKLIKESDWQVKIELDVQHKDRYGRILAYLWDKQGRMLNYIMITDGYAMVYTVPPNVKYTELLLQAQKLARQERKGIWSQAGLMETPSEWRKKHSQTY